MIITNVILTIVRYLDYQLPLAEAAMGPRFHHQWRPNQLMVEKTLPPEILEGLRKRGHELDVVSSGTGGRTQAVALSADGESLVGEADPRGDGAASGP
jgi:gamma-glutamyltranspeptidase/glutathione hydrolase